MSPSDSPRGADTRLEIIVAAHDLFLRKGYHGTSMRRIAAAAGIALGGIYNHFNSKEDIFREVMIAYHPYRDILNALSARTFNNFEEMLRQSALLINSTFEQRPDLINLMFIEMVEFRSRHIPELLELILPRIQEIFTRLPGPEGRSVELPMPIILRSFISTIIGYFITRNALGTDSPAAFRDLPFDQFIDIYLHGILNLEALK